MSKLLPIKNEILVSLLGVQFYRQTRILRLFGRHSWQRLANVCAVSFSSVTAELTAQSGLAGSPSVSCLLHFIGDTW